MLDFDADSDIQPAFKLRAPGSPGFDSRCKLPMTLELKETVNLIIIPRPENHRIFFFKFSNADLFSP